jgi:hypothetical protein
MAQLEVTTGSIEQLGAEGAVGAACHADAPSASRGSHPEAVVSHPLRGEPAALWDEAVRRFLVVSRAYLFPGPGAPSPRTIRMPAEAGPVAHQPGPGGSPIPVD